MYNMKLTEYNSQKFNSIHLLRCLTTSNNNNN
jgi:hypothetical protein